MTTTGSTAPDGTDPANAAEASDTKVEDPAHDVGEDEGWTDEGGATESGPATDT